jgi:nicotinamide-nucleotide amidase
LYRPEQGLWYEDGSTVISSRERSNPDLAPANDMAETWGMAEHFDKLAEKLGHRLLEREALLATAESCTGGWIAQAVTSVPGSSAWFDRGFVTYSNQAKQEMLGVSGETLAAYGAVSAPVVAEMAAGALCHSQARFAVAVTGIAGPGGGSQDKPVGTVYLAWAQRGQVPMIQRREFAGDRQAVRRQTVRLALETLIAWLDAGG